MGTSGERTEPTATRALRCFEELALEQGLDDVSMRDVAKRLGISLASLQYHYATKAALVDAAVASVVDVHRRRLDEAVASADGDDRFVEALRYIVAANVDDADGIGLMSMIWARAEHDATAAAALRGFMWAYVDRMTEAVVDGFPGLSSTQALLAAALTIALLEGLEDVRATAVDAGADTAQLTEVAVAVAAALPRLVAERS
ncbi:MAG: TetR/AcrR family transcriptional regulator [Actinomycetota bacterium]